jgi:hypothetical protein
MDPLCSSGEIEFCYLSGLLSLLLAVPLVREVVLTRDWFFRGQAMV